jgi:hypothetical protein
MCGHRRDSRLRYVDYEEPRQPDLRASEAEREEVVELLRMHAGEGRLEVAELEQRIESAYAARTQGDLAPLLEDLPPRPRPAGRAGIVAVASLVAALLPLAAAVALIAFAPHGVAWIGWPLLGWWFFTGGPARARGVQACRPSAPRRERTVVV